MPTNHKLAENLFKKYPGVISRGAAKLPLQEGDLVTDAGFADLPMLVDDSTGRIIARHGSFVRVEWRTGEREDVHVANLVRVRENYIPEFHDSVYDIPKFVPGTRVVLGNGDSARVLEKVTGPTGFHSFRVQIENSANPLYVGRRVYATPDGMYRVAGLAPDTVACFYKEGTLTPKATIGCEVVVDDVEQQVGLQKYSSLPQDDGMLFPYEPPRNVTFHMGSVAFPIDVIFVGPHGRIAAIEENCEPGVEQHWSHGRTSAVIEVNGGWCAARDIVQGDLVRLSNTKFAEENFKPHENRNDMGNFNMNKGLDNKYTTAPGNSRYKDRGLPVDILNSGDSIFSSGPGSESPGPGPTTMPVEKPDQQLGRQPNVKTDKNDNGSDGSGYNGYR
jgi:uncharacterized membrane protein (UPF0127 family)